MSGDFMDELFVPVWEGPYAEAQERMRWLEEAHIPVDLDDAASVGHARVVVDPGYVDDARRLMQGGPQATFDVPLLDPSTPWFRGWKVAVAILVIVAIVLIYVF